MPTLYHPGSPSTSSTVICGLAQGPAAACTAARWIVLVGHVLADPVVEFLFKIAACLPGADVLPLNHFEVVGQAVDHEHVGQLGAQLVVGFGFFAFWRVAEKFWLLGRVGRKKAALSLPLRMARAMKPSSASSNSRRSEMSTSVGILVWIAPMDSNW